MAPGIPLALPLDGFSHVRIADGDEDRAGELGMEFGRLFTPLGVYCIHFINGPILELGETRCDMLQLDHDLLPGIEFLLIAFKG